MKLRLFHLRSYSVTRTLVLFSLLGSLVSCAQLSQPPGTYFSSTELTQNSDEESEFSESMNISAEVAETTREGDSSNLGVYKFFDILPIALTLENDSDKIYVVNRNNIFLQSETNSYPALSSEEARRRLASKWSGIAEPFIFRDLDRGFSRWSIQGNIVVGPKTTEYFYIFFRVGNTAEFESLVRSPAVRMTATEIFVGENYEFSNNY